MAARSSGALDGGAVGVRAAVGDVVGDGAGEDERVLAHVADEPADRLARNVLHRDAADADLAGARDASGAAAP